MKLYDPKGWAVALGAGFLATLSLLPQARGEMVYENNNDTQTEERENLRQDLGASEKAQTTMQAQAPATVTTVQIQPQNAGEAPAADTGNFSKTELMRRERVRQEVKNEDLLEERLEELRLKDEKHRTNQLMGLEAGTDVNAAPAQAPAPMKEEMVSAPITEHPGQPATKPEQKGTMVASYQDPSAISHNEYQESEKADQLKFMITPKAGFSELMTSNSFNVHPHYSAGLGIGLGVSDNAVIEFGYQYSEYGLFLNSSNPAVAMYQGYLSSQQYGGSYENLTMKQNVFDLGLKLYLLSPESRIRPFVGGGVGYSKGYTNYNQQILSYLGPSGYSSADYEASSYLGFLQAGLDVKVSKSVSVGGAFKYYNVFSSRENSNIPYGAFAPGYMPYGYPGYGVAPYGAAPYGYPGYGAAPGAPQDQAKQAAGASLAESGFYTIDADVTFSF